MSLKYALALFLAFSTNCALAQVVEELVYSLTPIRDDCHYVFDDTSSIRVIHKADFQKIDRLWHTQDFCYGNTEDTVYFSEFELVFANPLGEVYGMFNITEGGRLSEDKSLLNDAIITIQSYSKVYVQNAQFEKEGVRYQVPNFSFVIDSNLQTKEDTCFGYFDILWQDEINLSKDSLLYLFQHAFCIDKCSRSTYWPSEVGQLYAKIGVNNRNSRGEVQYTIGPHFEIKNGVVDAENLEKLHTLKPHDLLVLHPISYRKGNTYYTAKSWRFKISD